MKILNWLFVSATLLIAGCVGIPVTVDPAASPKQGMGYLTGIFVDSSTLKGRKLGVTFENQQTKTQHTVTFQREGRDYQLIEVPPGTYRVASWFLADLFNSPIINGKPQGALFTREIKVNADQVHFLGHFSGVATSTVSGNMVYHNASLKPERIVPLSTDRDEFAKRFPNFGKLAMKSAFF